MQARAQEVKARLENLHRNVILSSGPVVTQLSGDHAHELLPSAYSPDLV